MRCATQPDATAWCSPQPSAFCTVRPRDDQRPDRCYPAGAVREEANQNLGAAIQAYQAMASQFDKDRKLAATAIFRLGECYRKQGNTNDAAASV